MKHMKERKTTIAEMNKQFQENEKYNGKKNV
jgi:hypothetical protein